LGLVRVLILVELENRWIEILMERDVGSSGDTESKRRGQKVGVEFGEVVLKRRAKEVFNKEPEHGNWEFGVWNCLFK